MLALWVYRFYKRSGLVEAYHIVMVFGSALLLVGFIPLFALFHSPVRYILWAVLNIWAAVLVTTLEARSLYNARLRNSPAEPEGLDFYSLGP
ncbi:hypothetical protein HD806DRAFT_499671 [Xylariaceae sp. AK1471]|nr:hypothetical protein HD806DRAFT_499671 [Xylariaceae sp. AK1471]